MAQYPIADMMSEIATKENIEQSFNDVVSHLDDGNPKDKRTGRRRPSQREKYEARKDEICTRLLADLKAGTFRISGYRNLHVVDGPKERDVQAPPVYDRVGCHAVMVVFERHVYPSLITNTAASIKGRGMHWLHHRLHEDLVNAPEQTTYFYYGDIYHFYDSILQPLMKAVVREYVSDPVLLPILDNFIEMLPTGLSKGLRSSQCFANILLDKIDKKMSSLVGHYEQELPDGTFEVRPFYYRYCDNFTILAPSKKELWTLRGVLVAELSSLGGLRIKPDEAVRPVDTEGIDALGYVDFRSHSRLRKRTKQNAARKLARVRSRKRRQEIIGSFKGMACHADCSHLYHKLTGKRMKKFSDMGISYTPKDGKKRFKGETFRLAAIQNIPIEIHDFEKDVKTSQGDGRCLVSFRNRQSGEWGKFFTASEEMKNILLQVGDLPDGFPFETVIVSERFDGNKAKYSFT